MRAWNGGVLGVAIGVSFLGRGRGLRATLPQPQAHGTQDVPGEPSVPCARVGRLDFAWMSLSTPRWLLRARGAGLVTQLVHMN